MIVRYNIEMYVKRFKQTRTFKSGIILNYKILQKKGKLK